MGVPIIDPVTVRYTLETPRANIAWASTRGAGTLVAVVDSGADFSNEVLQDRLVAGELLPGVLRCSGSRIPHRQMGCG